jgi:predicted TIM-barrel fold metal-dependent hydrolase
MVADGWDCHVHVFDGEPVGAPAHYAPPLRTLRMLALAALPGGVSRFVLVQPSVYGTDNRVLLAELQRGQGLHRGVVVVDESIGDDTLRSMDMLGVRGVRCNLVSPVGNSPAALARLAPRLRALGWHVQWYAQPSQLPDIAAFQERHGVTCVLDHVAGFGPACVDANATWAVLRRIADGGGWIKLSGWYRLDSTAPYVELDDIIQRAASMFGERCVWGSDWPHTKFLEAGCDTPAPAYSQTWRPVHRALGAALADEVLRTYPRQLYR